MIALGFALVGIDRIDPAAHGACLVRPLLLPGLTLLWPIVLLALDHAGMTQSDLSDPASAQNPPFGLDCFGGAFAAWPCGHSVAIRARFIERSPKLL